MMQACAKSWRQHSSTFWFLCPEACTGSAQQDIKRQKHAGAMAKKRRNSGRNKPAGARGHVRRVRCEQSGVLVPKDKAIKRFIVRNIVDASAVRDIQDACDLEGEENPEVHIVLHSCDQQNLWLLWSCTSWLPSFTLA